ncbi:sensor histidine kinase [Candidatus Ferrigenium straubiae]|jgi:two-component system sensor histidine kinase PilS (NtrC family)|uniref:sensor histidine kinase n=1 Tax=Candidatus Ferrigenium straubiae TaxID=2919506 RepID=UPI003F4A8E9E
MTDKLIAEFHPVDLWRSLRYFNLYRLALTSLFVFLAGALGHSLPLGARNWSIFFTVSLIYVVVVILSFIPLKLRWPHFSWQLAGQVGSDIVGLSVLSYASGGIQSNIGLLLLVSLAAAGLISRGKITLFFAALASIAALLEHSYAVLYADAEVAQYVQVGLLCISYFAVAWLAHMMAKYAVDSQQLAQRRGHDLASLSEANRLVMRDMQDGVLVVDEHGVIMQMNPSAARLLRHSSISGGSLAENFPLLFGQYALWKRTGAVSRDTLQLDVGVQARLRFVAVERNTAHGAVIFLEDMQRVRAEAQQIKLAALGRLTASIAHEVRNPLSAISYAAELMQEEQGDAKQQRLLQIVLDNTQRINRIVQDVMQLNRRDRAQLEVFELNAMLRTFVEEFSLAERLEPGVMVLAGIPGDTISFDRGHLRQVLWNLCRNALRYGRKMPGSLMLVMGSAGKRVMLDVQDDGPGISAEYRRRLFEPFFTTAADGTGLGLYIAKELCEANGAQLEYHGRDGQAGKEQAGACFRITFGELHEDGGGHEHGG